MGYGGTELVVHELSKGLRRLGHELVLFATGDSIGPEVRYLFRKPVWPPQPEAESAPVEGQVPEAEADQLP